MPSFTYLTQQGTKESLIVRTSVVHQTNTRVVSFSLSRGRADHIKLTFCPSFHWDPKEQQGILDISIHRCRAALLGRCCFGQNHTHFPPTKNVWQCGGLATHQWNGQTGFWTHCSLGHLSECSDFSFPSPYTKTLPLSTARNMGMIGTQREIPGVIFGFQSLVCEIHVGIFHQTTAGVQNKSTSGKRGQGGEKILYHQTASFIGEDVAALFS